MKGSFRPALKAATCNLDGSISPPPPSALQEFLSAALAAACSARRWEGGFRGRASEALAAFEAATAEGSEARTALAAQRIGEAFKDD